MNAWVHFFVGTPKRFLTTAAALIVLFAMVAPELARRAFSNALYAFFGAVNHLMEPLLMLLIVIAGYWLIFKPRKKKK
jgi:hypothetical protein